MVDADIRDRLIFALDVPSADRARQLVDELDGVVTAYKVGLELLLTGGASDLIDQLVERGRRVFLDLKLPGDIDATVERAVAVAAERGVDLMTLSATSSRRAIQAAVRGRGNHPGPKLLFVSFLSSMDRNDFAAETGRPAEDFETYLDQRTTMALDAGCDGLIVSGQEIGRARGRFPEALLVSPGIRPGGVGTDDHKRSTTPAEAIQLGSDRLVVGRPIRDAADRCAMAEAIVGEIAEACASGATSDDRSA